MPGRWSGQRSRPQLGAIRLHRRADLCSRLEVVRGDQVPEAWKLIPRLHEGLPAVLALALVPDRRRVARRRLLQHRAFLSIWLRWSAPLQRAKSPRTCAAQLWRSISSAVRSLTTTRLTVW